MPMTVGPPLGLALLVLLPHAAANLLPWDPSNVPGAGWPGADADSSNAAFPSGSQPDPLAAWPTKDNDDGSKQALPCWKVTALEDTRAGWAGQCSGLEATSAETAADCYESCANDPLCLVWQFRADLTCFQGLQGEEEGGGGVHCDNNNGAPLVAVVRAQRLQRGDVRVLKNMTGLDVLNLRDLGLWATGNSSTGAQHCRAYCYSNIRCQFWQYGPGGCFVEDPLDDPLGEAFGFDTNYKAQYPLTTNGGVTLSSAAFSGEYIQHICPARDALSTTAPPSIIPEAPEAVKHAAASWTSWLPWVGASIFVLLVCAVCICMVKPPEGDEAAEAQKRRALHMAHESHGGGHDEEEMQSRPQSRDMQLNLQETWREEVTATQPTLQQPQQTYTNGNYQQPQSQQRQGFGGFQGHPYQALLPSASSASTRPGLAYPSGGGFAGYTPATNMQMAQPRYP